MVTIAWKPDGFHVIEVLPKGTKFNADYYCSHVLTKLSKTARQFTNETRRKLIRHADDACPHTSKSSIEFYAKLDLTVAPHPPYSPDLALYDYLLFCNIKDELKGLSFLSALPLHRVITQTVKSIDRSTFIATFD
jgi:hypothetical protein